MNVRNRDEIVEVLKVDKRQKRLADFVMLVPTKAMSNAQEAKKTTNFYLIHGKAQWLFWERNESTGIHSLFTPLKFPLCSENLRDVSYTCPSVSQDETLFCHTRIAAQVSTILSRKATRWTGENAFGVINQLVVTPRKLKRRK